MSTTGSPSERITGRRPTPAMLPFRLLAGSAFAFLIVTRIAQRGMFLDGITYAVLARNLAAGRGTFWEPFYTATLYPHFHEQPPLGVGLQALAFALLGDHLVVERLYSFAAGGAIALMLVALWRTTIRSPSYDWLPIVFWLLPASLSWAIVNNMLEVTQALFTTLSVVAFLRSLEPGRWGAWAVVAGLSIPAAVLTKGPTGFFPLAAPAIAWLLWPERRASALRSGAAMVVVVAAAAAAIAMWDAARASLAAYSSQQLVAAVLGERGGRERWDALYGHLGAGVVGRMLGLSALLWLGGKAAGARTASAEDGHSPRWTTFFLLLALAGSLPIGISGKIAGHYFVPSISFFALGFAGLSWTSVARLVESDRAGRGARAAATGLGVLLVLATIVMPIAGRSPEPRDVALMKEYVAITPAMPRGETVGTCDENTGEWGIHAYMQRFFEVSLDAGPTRASHRFFVQMNERPCPVAPECERRATTTRFAVLECERK